jgi:membrane fusion protein (multidrug efflux system)
VLALLCGCSPDVESRAANGGGPRAPRAAAPPVAVVTQAVNSKELALDIESVGTARANESVNLTSRTTNTVTAIRFNEGERVRRGDVLVEFDSAQTRAEVAEAEALVMESKAQFERSRSLSMTGVLSQAQLDQIQATYKANEARVAAAKARFSDTVIRAPFDGRTGFRRISIGSLVSPGTAITTLDDTSVMKVEFTVPQTYQHALSEGLPVTAVASGLPGRQFEGRVTVLDSRVDQVTRSINLRAEIGNRDGALKPGTFMSVKMRAAPAAALVVAEAALVPEQGKIFVFVVADGLALKREVSIGRRMTGAVEVLTGLQEGERVIVEGTQKVRDQVAVRESDYAPVATDS